MVQQGKKEPRVDFDGFKKGVSLIRDTLKEKRGELNFGIKGINFRSDMPSNQLEDKYNLQKEDIDPIVNDVLEIINIVLSGKKDKVTTDLKDNKPNLLQTFKKRCELVERELIDQNLLRKYLIQTNYKTALLDKVDWDIITKRINRRKKTVDFPSAMVRVRVKKPFTDEPPVPKTETIVFESGIEEIEELIDELNEIKNSLKEEEERLK